MENYNDGFTMAEQAELRRQYKPIKCHVTEKFMAEAADKLIAKLNQDLGAANAYIAELEDSFKQEKERLEKEINALKTERNLLMQRFSNGITEMYKEERFTHLLQETNELKKRCKRIESDRDGLVYQLNQLRNAAEANSRNV